MLGHLVPCGGGKAMALNNSRLVLSRKSSATEGAVTSTNDAELRLVDGWWHVRRFESGRPLAVNGHECESAKLKPNDVLTVGGKFFRITYEAPEPAVPTVTPEPSSTTAADPVPITVASTSSAGAPHFPVTPHPAAPRPATPNSTLGMLIPCGGGPPVALRKPKFIIGRAPTCDLVLAYKSTSSRHCSLELHNGYWQMTDLDSTNGTTVDGMTYRRKWILPGNVLGLPGKRYRVEYRPQGTPPSLADDDEVIVPNRPLLELAGIMERLVDLLPTDEPTRTKWKLG